MAPASASTVEATLPLWRIASMISGDLTRPSSQASYSPVSAYGGRAMWSGTERIGVTSPWQHAALRLLVTALVLAPAATPARLVRLREGRRSGRDAHAPRIGRDPRDRIADPRVTRWVRPVAVDACGGHDGPRISRSTDHRGRARVGCGGLSRELEPAHEALYARYGFERGDPIELPAGAPVVTAMWRDPR